jgi:hypothetical protein
MLNKIKKIHTQYSLVLLFLVSAFPLHLWSLLMGFRDFGWVAIRTQTWDAVGLLAYAMAFALLESLMIFLILLALSYLLPWSWNTDKRTALTGSMYLMFSLWVIGYQIYGAMGQPVPEWVASNAHPVRIVAGLLLLLTILTFGQLCWYILRNDTFPKKMVALFENLSMLSAFYLLLDLIGILIIIIRNIN